MDMYERRETKSKNRCGYCREVGHNMSTCPHVASDWASWQRLEVPLKDPNHWTRDSDACGRRGHWYLFPRYWGEWYENCRVATKKQEAYQARQGLAKKRQAPKCGFCGGTDHNRRNCAELLAYRQKANLANQAFRRYVYDQMVTQHGLSVGALVEIKKRKYMYSQGRYAYESEGVCTITAISWDTISITSDYGRRNLDYDLRTPIMISYVAGSGTSGQFVVKLDNFVIDENTAEVCGVAVKPTIISQVISPSPTPLDAAWVSDARQEAYDWLTKKRDIQWLEKKGITALVDLWYKKHLWYQEQDNEEQ
jgi:hypothetical protein